jgi:hypothetical protein
MILRISAASPAQVGNLMADGVRPRDRIAGSRGCREQWLTGCVDTASWTRRCGS